MARTGNGVGNGAWEQSAPFAEANEADAGLRFKKRMTNQKFRVRSIFNLNSDAL